MPGPTLKQIADQFESLAKLNVQTPPNKAVDTGKLRDSIRVLQTQTNAKGGAIFDLKTVYYGYFVETGTRYMRARPFGKQAADSDTLKMMIDEYFKSVVNVTVMETMQSTNKKLQKFVKKP